MNEFKLKEGFKLLFGSNIYSYCLHFKLQGAKDSMLNTNDSSIHIATDAGYADTGTFIKAFRKKYGCSPGWYRKEGQTSSQEHEPILQSLIRTDQPNV